MVLVIVVVIVALLLAVAVVAGVVVVARRRGAQVTDDLHPWYGLGDWQQAPADADLGSAKPGEPNVPGSVLAVPYHLRLQTVLRGSHRGFTATAYEYSYRELNAAGPRGTGPKRYTVVTIELPMPRPTLDVARSRDPGPPSTGDPSFDATFRVTADNAGFAQDVLTPPVRQWLLADPRPAYFPAHIEGDTISTYYDGGCYPELLGPMVDYLVEWCTRVPAPVWRR